MFNRITRFQKISDKILKNEFNSLSELSYEHGYFDQTHFIKECREFTGVTPAKLAEGNIAVKSIIRNFSY